MEVKALRTEKIRPGGPSLLEIVDAAVSEMADGSVLAITSKIVAICEGRLRSLGEIDKAELVHEESELYLPADESKYNITLTVKEGVLIPTAGIDESNTDGHYVLWPADSQATANMVRDHLTSRFLHRRLGIIITDSTTSPLRWGTKGICLAHSGFKALNNYIGEPDIFGQPLKVTKANIADALAAAAVLVMGEGAEQTPLAILSDLPFVEFQDRNPNPEEIAEKRIPLEDDLYASLLTRAPWKKGAQSDNLQP